MRMWNTYFSGPGIYVTPCMGFLKRLKGSNQLQERSAKGHFGLSFLSATHRIRHDVKKCTASHKNIPTRSWIHVRKARSESTKMSEVKKPWQTRRCATQWEVIVKPIKKVPVPNGALCGREGMRPQSSTAKVRCSGTKADFAKSPTWTRGKTLVVLECNCVLLETPNKSTRALPFMLLCMKARHFWTHPQKSDASGSCLFLKSFGWGLVVR